MNVKRFIWAALALFVFIFLYEWLVNGFLLSHLYQQTPQLWRPMEEMAAKMPLWIVIQLIVAFWLALVFTQLFREGKVKNGVRFGLYIGVFAGLLMGSSYLWLPVSALLGWSWFFSWLIEGVVGGTILGAIYRR